MERLRRIFKRPNVLMDTNSVSPLPPPEAPLAMMEGEKTPPRSPGAGGEAGDGALPPPPDEK